MEKILLITDTQGKGMVVIQVMVDMVAIQVMEDIMDIHMESNIVIVNPQQENLLTNSLHLETNLNMIIRMEMNSIIQILIEEL